VTSWLRPGRRLDASKVHGLAAAPGMAGRPCVRLCGIGTDRLQRRARRLVHVQPAAAAHMGYRGH